MISYYNNVKSNQYKKIDINQFLTLLKNNNIKTLTEKVRVYDKETQKDEYRKEQSNLPIICFSALFKEKSNHSLNDFVEHTNLLCLDYDGLDNVEKIFNILKEIPFIYLMYRSTSNKGIKVVLKVNLDKLVNISADMTDAEAADEYNKVNKLYYDYLGELLYKHINTLPDELAKDITRCSYVAYDYKYYYNRNSQKYELTIKEAEAFNKKKLKNVKIQTNKTTAVGSAEVLFMNEVINFLLDKKLDITSDYNDWIYLAYLCKKLYDPKTALIKFQQISSLNPNYNSTETSKKFNNILNVTKDKPTSFSFLDKILKNYGISFIPKQSKNLFKEKLDKNEVQRIIEFENWEIKFCKIKKLHLLYIPNLNHDYYPDNIIPLELSGRKGYPILWQYFNKNYSLDLADKDIENNIYSYKSTPFNFLQDKLEQIKTEDNTEYERFFNLIESDIDIKDPMTRWFIGSFENWLNDYGRKYDEMLILHDDKGNIGKTDLIYNYMFNIFRYSNLNYLTSNTNFNMANKDMYIDDASCLISYKPEISSAILKKSELVKDYISRRQTNLRVPYGRNQEEFNSYTSYIGDTNDENFLSAEQNRRRFIVIHINKLNFLGANFDWEKFWGYLYFLYKDKNKRYNDYNTIDNIEYVELDTDMALLDEVLSKDDNAIINTTELISMITSQRSSFKLSKNEITKYLKMRGYEYRPKWSNIFKKMKKGWNINLNMSNSFQVVENFNELFDN